ncbi:EcsC family protein [Insolitispirillum peregrinum]|uniref:EcsC protein family protein n=1 Tax=Insolitispirillum peregrinum TaxID=80876 RepID=A0A1N7PF16_9PROT|nr:EcsC family protein [Insolitispirillum peregrinum]SIT09158.1 EcsC protein family protein [Insolitispirillum peregrinum]
MWTDKDHADLENAVLLLEKPGFLMRLSNALGERLEIPLKALPESGQKGIAKVSRVAIRKALDAALYTVRDAQPRPASNRLHTGMTIMSGAVGGVMGLSGLAVELPLTTVLMMRSIIDIARSEGEDIRAAETSLACLQVFAMGSGKRSADSEFGYYAIRAGLAQSLAEATQTLTQQAANSTSSAVTRLIGMIAAHFHIGVSEKAIAQALPLVGAVSGATINAIFTRHYQDMARGHFIVRRLERAHGPALVQDRYRELALVHVPEDKRLPAD